MMIVEVLPIRGDVILKTQSGQDVPASMIWHYGEDCKIQDKVGQQFWVEISDA